MLVIIRIALVIFWIVLADRTINQGRYKTGRTLFHLVLLLVVIPVLTGAPSVDNAAALIFVAFAVCILMALLKNPVSTQTGKQPESPTSEDSL